METHRRLFKEFLSKSYINGLQLLVYQSPVRYAKTLWLIFLAVIVIWTHIIIVNLTQEYLVQPTEIHMSPNLVHVSNSPFPAIGVCTANKISKSLLKSYAIKIQCLNAGIGGGQELIDDIGGCSWGNPLTSMYASLQENTWLVAATLGNLHTQNRTSLIGHLVGGHNYLDIGSNNVHTIKENNRITRTLQILEYSQLLGILAFYTHLIEPLWHTNFSTPFSYQQQQQQQAINSSDSPQLALNADDMAQRLLVLTEFYLNPHDEPQLDKLELTQLHWLLSSYYNDTEYSVRDILRHLSPDCSELVIRGIVFGGPVNASQLFIKRPTSTSVCCIFNYHRRSYSRIEAQRAQDDAEMSALPNVVFESNSILNSVQFVLQDMPEEEYTYTYLSNNAFQLKIFPQEDYASVQSTALGEILVDHNTIVEIPIQPKFFDASESLRHISPKTRYCYYPEEGRHVLNQSYYSLDECLLFCRVESMLNHCGCVSPPMAGSAINLKFCTLPDLPCLMKWKMIWYGYNEFSYVDEGIDQSAQRQCEQCLPTCDGVSFDITSNVAPLRNTIKPTGYLTGLLKGLTNNRPLAIIKLYFKLRFAQETKTEIVSTWVVLLNRFGGILSLMYGFSIVSYIEIVYYLTGKWFVYIYRAFHSKTVFINKSLLPTNLLYWQEVVPKGLKYPLNLQEVHHI
ncbi:sodium channel protein Nach [Drosophila tropicalis]|uniref:sodium channel protein Nach n=1 Tax=Drosophila tropicalis TaxID=46794 RepID=UPI0035ABFCF4